MLVLSLTACASTLGALTAGPRRVLATMGGPAALDVAELIGSTRARLESLAAELGRPPARLVAVSKTKSPELLMQAYAAGQRDFGENYVNEIVAKAPLLPADIRWRFIGALQSNKAKQLVLGVPGLCCVETVDRLKVAKALDAAVQLSPRSATKLSVMLQVNTSGEESKSGCVPSEAAALALEIARTCAHLDVVGVMTIGAPRPALSANEPDPDFATLAACRSQVAAALCADAHGGGGGQQQPEAALALERRLELSMGMSADWERAIRQGSTSVRIGSAIFGARA